MSAVAPFTLLCEAMEKELTAKMDAWLRDLYSGWFSDADKYFFTITNKNKALQIDNNIWDIYGNSSTYWLAFKKDVSAKNKVIAEMFELDSHASFKTTKFTETIYQDFIDSCVSSIFERTNLTYIRGTDILKVSADFGSGAITGTLSNGTVSLPVTLGGDLVKAICSESNQKLQSIKPAHNLASREGSVDKYKSKLEVSAGKAKISLRDFSIMEVGDIVILDTEVGSPFAVYLPGKAPLQAQLGNLINKKAIQLIE